jgi:hypothetical protein
MDPLNVPSRNVRSYAELAEGLFGETTPTAVEVVTLKILVSALSVILLDKGICSRKDIQRYVQEAHEMYFTLKSVDEKNKQ